MASLISGILRVYGTPAKPRLPITKDILLGTRSRLDILDACLVLGNLSICLVSFLDCFVKHTSHQVLTPDVILERNSPDLISRAPNLDTQFCWDGAKPFEWGSTIHVFFIRKILIRKWVIKTQNLKKMLRKSLASNTWAAIFKNTDFSSSSLKVTNLREL